MLVLYIWLVLYSRIMFDDGLSSGFHFINKSTRADYIMSLSFL